MKIDTVNIRLFAIGSRRVIGQIKFILIIERIGKGLEFV